MNGVWLAVALLVLALVAMGEDSYWQRKDDVR